MMTEGEAQITLYGERMSDPGFQNEIAQIRARAALSELPGSPPEVHWTYSLSRVLRNATAALIDVEALLRISLEETGNLTQSSRRLGQLWESLSKITNGNTSETALVNAILAYELAGYQANAICIAKGLGAPSDGNGIDSLTRLVAAFYRRQFFQISRLAFPLLQSPSLKLREISEIMVLAAQGLVAEALMEASKYFLGGNGAQLTKSLELLSLASEGFATTGDVEHHNLTNLLRLTIPRMRSRSTWELLLPFHPENVLWRRYLFLLARGLGRRIDENSGVVELWPSQIRALESGLFNHSSSTMVRMPTSAGKTRIAEMAIVNHLISNPGERCVYIAPFRALAGEIEGSLAGLISDLGFQLSTTWGTFESDEAEQQLLADADVIVSTPEKLDMLLRLRPGFFEKVGVVVVDEGQLVEDPSRGPDFELLLTRIRRRWPGVRFISLSAVIPDATLKSFAEWLGDENTVITQTDWRPAIQRLAQFRWQDTKGFLRFLPDADAVGIEEFLPNVAEVRRFPFVNPVTGRQNAPRFPDVKIKAQTAAELAFNLASTGSVLIFCSTRPNAEAVGKALLERIHLTKQAGQVVPPQFSERVTRASQISVEWLGEDHPITLMLQNGIAIHHAGVPDAIRKAIEGDFRDRKFQVVIATNTLAQGVNLPIKTVIVHSYSRRIEDISVALLAREYWNIAGRAGRAGEETEGWIVHICQSQHDFSALQFYADKRNDLEPLRSALLIELTRRVAERISDASSVKQLDAGLLALLVEEDVSEVDEEWVEQVFGRSLASIEARRQDLDMQVINRSFGDLLRDVIERVPDETRRKRFSVTGLCVQSCELLSAHINDNRDALSSLLTSATLSNRRELIDLFLEGCFQADEIRPREEPSFDIAELTELWISGADYATMRSMTVALVDTATSLSSFIEDAFAYRLPWGIASYIRLATRELELEEFDLSEVIRFFPAMIKHGVPTPQAVWAVTVGVNYRSVAIEIGQSYTAEGNASSFSGFLDWASKWTVEGLSAAFNLRGTVLEDVAFALQKASPNSLIKQSAITNEPGAPVPSEVVIEDRWALIVSDGISEGDTIAFRRDYDSTYDRNAVVCYFEQEYLGGLANDVAQLIAPLMDAGNQFEGTALNVVHRGRIRRLRVLISPVVEN